jgi:hypothetical protein
MPINRAALRPVVIPYEAPLRIGPDVTSTPRPASAIRPGLPFQRGPRPVPHDAPSRRKAWRPTPAVQNRHEPLQFISNRTTLLFRNSY